MICLTDHGIYPEKTKRKIKPAHLTLECNDSMIMLFDQTPGPQFYGLYNIKIPSRKDYPVVIVSLAEIIDKLEKRNAIKYQQYLINNNSPYAGNPVNDIKKYAELHISGQFYIFKEFKHLYDEDLLKIPGEHYIFKEFSYLHDEDWLKSLKNPEQKDDNSLQFSIKSQWVTAVKSDPKKEGIISGSVRNVTTIMGWSDLRAELYPFLKNVSLEKIPQKDNLQLKSELENIFKNYPK